MAWLGAAFWATLAIDWFFEPPPAVRAAMLGAIGLVLAAVVVQLIGRRAFVRITDSNAATVLERRFSELDDSLLTAVMLDRTATEGSRLQPADARRDLPGSGRPGCRRRSAEGLQSAAAAAQRRWRRSLLVLSVAVFAILFVRQLRRLGAAHVGALATSFGRGSTRLAIEGFPDNVQKVARGADVEVIATADTRMPRVPDVVEVRYRTEGGGRGRETMDRRGGAARPAQGLPGICLHLPQRADRHSLRPRRRRRPRARPVDSGGRQPHDLAHDAGLRTARLHRTQARAVARDRRDADPAWAAA